MNIFDFIKNKPEGFEKIGRWKMLRKSLHSKFDYKNNWYLLKKHGVIHHLTEEDCIELVKDLTGIKE